MYPAPESALPPHILERDDVRRALAAHDFGAVFTLVRKWSGLSFNKIAEACDIKPARVGQIARGEARITTLDKIEHIADVFRVPGHMLRLAPRPWEKETGPAGFPASVTDRQHGLVPLGPGPWEIANLMRRTQATDVGPAELEAIEIAVDGLCRAYPYMPAPCLHKHVQQGIRHVTQLLEGRTTLRQHRELLVFAGWLFVLNGCVQYDMGQREAAELCQAAAQRIGQETGHGEVTAWSWELGAWFALTQNRCGDILDCVEAGHHANKTHSVGVQLYAHAAKAHARMGDTRQVRENLDAGRARLERLPRPSHPEHHFVIDPDKWDFYAMDAYRMIRDDERAAAHAHDVIRTSTAPDGTEQSPMRIAEARLTLAVAAARSGELEKAMAIATRALDADRKSLPSLLLVAGELNDELQRHYPNESMTNDFRGRVQDIAQASGQVVEG